MAENPFSLWSYLETTQLLWLTVTLAVWLMADALSKATGRRTLANPVLISIIIICLILAMGRVEYETYFEGAQFVHFMLGPATVALAAPLYQNAKLLKRNFGAITCALAVGASVGVLSAVWMSRALGLPEEAVLSLAPKSATSPVAMGVAEQVGGEPELTAVLVILTGLIGALAMRPVMALMRISNPAAQGFATGLSASGIGAAQAFTEGPQAGAFAGVGMALCAIATAALTPILI